MMNDTFLERLINRLIELLIATMLVILAGTFILVAVIGVFAAIGFYNNPYHVGDGVKIIANGCDGVVRGLQPDGVTVSYLDYMGRINHDTFVYSEVEPKEGK